MGEIERVMAMIDAAAGNATSYTKNLATVTEKLGQSKDREGLRVIVESLVQSAKEMEESNQKRVSIPASISPSATAATASSTRRTRKSPPAALRESLKFFA
jgi:ribosomal protein L12E/L44/L45/RPP1/RPP2